MTARPDQLFVSVALMMLVGCGDDPAAIDSVDEPATSAKMASEPGRIEGSTMAVDMGQPAAPAIMSLAEAHPELSTFVRAAASAGFGDRLGAGDHTIFAPNDAAFEALPKDALPAFEEGEGRQHLGALLGYHAVAGERVSEALRQAVAANGGEMQLMTLNGEPLTVGREGDALVLTDGRGGRAKLVSTDLDASDGVLHVIDAVLMPGREIE